MKTAPEGLSLGRLRGKCLFALTRQPLRRSGQPKAAAPDSWIRVASAPGEWSCIHGKPAGRNRAIVFSDAFRGLGAQARAWRGGGAVRHRRAAWRGGEP